MSTATLQETRVLRRNGKSFFWASRLLGARHAGNAAALYAFCRMVDDFVDEGGAGEADLALLRGELCDERSPRAAIQRFRGLRHRLGLDSDVIEQFLVGITKDAGFVRIVDEDDLVQYCYGVAGTVGLMMCAALDVENDSAHPFAVDLGIGMQLSNICRDVLEDAERDRIYLPRTLLGADVTTSDLLHGDPAARLAAERAVHRLLDIADRYYRSADRGMRYLPRRARLAILTASRVYEGIGQDVRARLADGRYWGRRAFVPSPRKLVRTLDAFRSQLFDPRYWNVGRRPVHDRDLHRALRGCRGSRGDER